MCFLCSTKAEAKWRKELSQIAARLRHTALTWLDAAAQVSSSWPVACVGHFYIDVFPLAFCSRPDHPVVHEMYSSWIKKTCSILSSKEILDLPEEAEQTLVESFNAFQFCNTCQRHSILNQEKLHWSSLCTCTILATRPPYYMTQQHAKNAEHAATLCNFGSKYKYILNIPEA